MTRPYIACWSGEAAIGATQQRKLMAVRGRLRYRDEHAGDRDGMGVLWARCPDRPGAGQLMLGRIHPRRQRAAIWQMRCQVCGGKPDENGAGVLWLLPGSRGGDDPAGQASIRTSFPPICARCLRVSERSCPELHAGSLVLRVRAVRLAGVFAEPYIALTGRSLMRTGLRPDGKHPPRFGYDDPGLAMALATHQLIDLHEVTVIRQPDPRPRSAPGLAAPETPGAVPAPGRHSPTGKD